YGVLAFRNVMACRCCDPSQIRRRGISLLACFATQLSALALRQTAPDAKAFVVVKRILKALRSHFAPVADSFCFTSRATFFWKKCLRVSLRAERVCLPR